MWRHSRWLHLHMTSWHVTWLTLRWVISVAQRAIERRNTTLQATTAGTCHSCSPTAAARHHYSPRPQPETPGHCSHHHDPNQQHPQNLISDPLKLIPQNFLSDHADKQAKYCIGTQTLRCDRTATHPLVLLELPVDLKLPFMFVFKVSLYFAALSGNVDSIVKLLCLFTAVRIFKCCKSVAVVVSTTVFRPIFMFSQRSYKHKSRTYGCHTI